MSQGVPMDEDSFWSIVEQAMEDEQRLAHILERLPTGHILAYERKFALLTNELDRSQQLRQILRNRHYTWSDDCWLYFRYWVIMQGKFVYTLALQASQDFLPFVDQASRLDTWTPPGMDWYRTRSLPDFEKIAYIPYYVLEERDEAEQEEQDNTEVCESVVTDASMHSLQNEQDEPAIQNNNSVSNIVNNGNTIMVQGMKLLGTDHEQEGQARLHEAIKIYDQATHSEVNALAAVRNKAILLFGLGHYEEALNAFEHLLRVYPNDTFILKRKGQALRALERAEEALMVFEQLHRLDPDNLSHYYEQGHILFRAERYEEALAIYDTILQSLNPDDAQLHHRRGETLLHLQRTEEALAAFEQALPLDPDWLPAYVEKGKVLLRFERYEEALSACEQVLRLDPSMDWAIQARSWLFERLHQGSNHEK